jgi:hypothetical protein
MKDTRTLVSRGRRAGRSAFLAACLLLVVASMPRPVRAQIGET